MRYCSALLTTLFVLASLPPCSVSAEPIASDTLLIRAGTAEFDWTDMFSGFNLTGSNFRIELVSNPSASPGFSLFQGRVDPSIESSTIGNGFGRITVNGNIRDLENEGWTLLYRIDGPDVVPIMGDGAVTVAFPFRFTASLTGGGIGDTFSYELTGRGFGQWTTNEDLSFTRYGLFSFEDAAPVPEPTTVALVTCAITLAGYRRRLRRRG